MDLYSSLCTITKEENILRDEPMCRHTTFRVGGPADFFVTPKAKEEVRDVIRICKEYSQYAGKRMFLIIL